MGEAAFSHGFVNYIYGALYQAALVRVFNTKNKIAAVFAGDQPGIQRCAQIAHVHIAGGRRGKTSAHPPFGNVCFHIIKKLQIKSHNGNPPKWKFTDRYIIMAFFRGIVKDCLFKGIGPLRAETKMSDEDTGAGRVERFSENAKLDCTFLMIMLK